VELAVTLPVLLMLAFGGLQFVRLAIASAGLDAATAAAAAAAARAPNATAASGSGSAAFAGVAAGYGLGPSAVVGVGLAGFQRGGTVTARGRCAVELGFSGVPALRLSWLLHSTATARIEDWRSRTASR